MLLYIAQPLQRSPGHGERRRVMGFRAAALLPRTWSAGAYSVGKLSAAMGEVNVNQRVLG
jgi:hypothetical protein